jgi:hypothetical protein
MTPALRRLLGLTRIGPVDGILTVAMSVIPLLVNELTKQALRGDRQ